MNNTFRYIQIPETISFNNSGVNINNSIFSIGYVEKSGSSYHELYSILSIYYGYNVAAYDSTNSVYVYFPNYYLRICSSYDDIGVYMYNSTSQLYEYSNEVANYDKRTNWKYPNEVVSLNIIPEFANGINANYNFMNSLNRFNNFNIFKDVEFSGPYHYNNGNYKLEYNNYLPGVNTETILVNTYFANNQGIFIGNLLNNKCTTSQYFNTTDGTFSKIVNAMTCDLNYDYFGFYFASSCYGSNIDSYMINYSIINYEGYSGGISYAFTIPIIKTINSFPRYNSLFNAAGRLRLIEFPEYYDNTNNVYYPILNTSVNDFSYMFNGCIHLPLLQDNLFFSCDNMINISHIHHNCLNLKFIPPMNTSSTIDFTNMIGININAGNDILVGNLLDVPFLNMNNAKYISSMFNNQFKIGNNGIANIVNMLPDASQTDCSYFENIGINLNYYTLTLEQQNILANKGYLEYYQFVNASNYYNIYYE